MPECIYATDSNNHDYTCNSHTTDIFQAYPREFYRNSALKDIYLFAQKYQTQVRLYYVSCFQISQ